MPLDPEAQAIIDAVREAGIPAWHTLPVDEARVRYEARTRMLGGEPIPVASVRDVRAPGAAGELDARVYHPAPGTTPPILLYLHGGGWVLGSLDTHDRVCRELARETGAVVVSPAYRLAPEHPHPAALEDAYAVLSWLAGPGGAEVGGDGTRIAVSGDSAGGHLTAALCLLARDRGGPRIAAQAPIYPAVEPRFDTPSMIANRDGYLLTREDLIWFWGHLLDGAAPGVATDPASYAAPLLAVDVSGLPPAIVVTAEYDPLRDEGRAWAARLASAGVNVELAEYQGVTHNFVVLPGEMPKGRDAVRRIAAWLQRAWAG
ncbi:MAG: alpha/beta hydrolase [Chloroflexota bacterium]